MAHRNLLLLTSTQVQAAETAYGEWIEVGDLSELTLFLEVTAQGTYTDETLDVTIQHKSHSGQIYDLVSFTQVGNATGSLPSLENKDSNDFAHKHAGWIRIKRVTAGTSVDYTFTVNGYGRS